MANMKTLTVNGITYTVDDPDAVSYGAQQELTEAQKQQARDNIGAVSREQMEKAIADADTVHEVFLYCNENTGGQIECDTTYAKLKEWLWNEEFIQAFLCYDLDGKTHYAFTSTVYHNGEDFDILFDFAGLGTAWLDHNNACLWQDNDLITKEQLDAAVKDVIDKTCPAFSKSGTVVTCEPVEGYPLDVAATGWGIKNYLEGFDINQLDRQNLYVLNLQPGDYRISVEYDEESADGDGGQWLALNVSGDSGASWEISEMVYDYDNGIHQEVAFTVTGAEDEQWALQSGEGFYYITSLMLNKAPSQIIRCGKNLIGWEDYSWRGDAENGEIKNGLITRRSVIDFISTFILSANSVLASALNNAFPPGTYVLSFPNLAYSGFTQKPTGFYADVELADGTETTMEADAATVFQQPWKITQLRTHEMFQWPAGCFLSVNIQIEPGTKATAFEPYCGETFAPGDTVPALPGVNTIYADAGEVTVTGRANPAAIIEKLTNAVGL